MEYKSETLISIIVLNAFMGSIVYLQFSSFSSVVNEIVRIREGADDYSSLIRSSIVLGLSFLIPTIVSNVLGYCRIIFRMQQGLHLEMHKIEKQSSLDIGTIESNSYQTLLRAAKEWGSGSVLSLQDFVFTSASSFAGIITSMLILWSLSPWLVAFAVCAALPVYFFYKKYSLEVFRVRYLSVDDHRIISNRISHFEELQKAVDVILLDLKDWLRLQIVDKKTSYNAKIAQAEKKKSVSYGVLSLWYLVFLFAAIALMTYDSLRGAIEVGGLLLAFNTYTRFYQTVNNYVESISYTEEAGRYAAKWFELFDLKPKIYPPDNALKLKLERPPLIEFKNVSFRYPTEDGNGPYVLKDLNLTILPGEKVAIVGINGAGKTTLIKLLCRVYDPTEGSILVNGHDLKNLDVKEWQRYLGILFQDFPNYNMTIRQAIALGNINAKVDQESVELAAGYSGANEFVKDYDQLIWKDFKGGVDLSKGQHQRLAVARMFYRKALVTILDEPTASIDAVTEEKIFTSLEENMNGKTVVLITHRFSTVRNADKIVLLDDGEIVELGTHEQLMSVNGKYAKLFRIQAQKYLEKTAV